MHSVRDLNRSKLYCYKLLHYLRRDQYRLTTSINAKLDHIISSLI